MQNIWVIGSNPPLFRVPIPEGAFVNNIAISKTTCYFTTSDNKLGQFSPTSNSDVLPPSKIIYEQLKDVVQIVCGNEYVAFRTSTGEIYARGNPFLQTFTRVKNKREAEMPSAITIAGTPYFLFAIIAQGRFCIITGNSVIYHKKRNVDRWYIACAMFLGTVLLLAHTGRAYTMSFNENNPTLSNTLQVFSEDPCVFTSLFSCHESLFFLTVDDYVVSYGYNHHGCLGVCNENPVGSLLRYRPTMNGESIAEIAPSSDYTFFLTHSGNLYVSGQSPYDKSCSSEPVLFKPLEGKRITQIKACGNICIALEGGHKDYNSTSTPPDNYKQFLIVVMPTYYTGVLGGATNVLPFPENYASMWYHPGDIVLKKELKGKVIGLNAQNMPIIAVSNLKRVMVLEDTNHHDYLVRRPGHNLINMATSTKQVIMMIKLDTCDSVITTFGGFRYADIVETDKGQRGTIMGARGEYLWIKPTYSSSVICAKGIELTLIERPAQEGEKEKSVFVPIDVDTNERYWVISADAEKDDLFYTPELGLCYLVGQTDFGHHFYRRINSSKNYIKLNARLQPVRKYKDSISDVSHILLSDYVYVKNMITCYVDTAPLGFLAYDRVLTPKGYGTVLGALSNGNIIVMTDQMYLTLSLADCFPPYQLELVAKVDSNKCTKKFHTINNQEIELLINISAFKDKGILVQDRIILKKKYGFIVGICEQDDKVYCMLDDEDFVQPLGDDLIKYSVILRYLHVMYSCFYGNTCTYATLMKLSGMTIKPGDVLNHLKKEFLCVGVANNSVFAFVVEADDFSRAVIMMSAYEIDYSKIEPDIPPIKFQKN